MAVCRFDQFELDTQLFELRCSGSRVPIEPQVYDLLEFLVRHRDRVVTKDELIEHIWPEKYITEAALSTRLMSARKALGDSGDEQRYIRTVRGRGFRFEAEVVVLDGGAAPDSDLAAEEAPDTRAAAVAMPRIQFARTRDGLNVAYSVTGSGVPLVRVLGWFTHLELEWRWAAGRRFWERLSQSHRLLRYDGRGMGLSDPATVFNRHTRMADLEAVVDAFGADPVVLLGISEGANLAVRYAVEHPDRVAGLISYGWGVPPNEEEKQRFLEKWESLLRLIAVGWGTETDIDRNLFAQMFLGSGATPEELSYFAAMQTASASTEVAVNYLRSVYAHKLPELAQSVAVPTLVVHRRGDLIMPHTWARQLAGIIPGAEFLLQEGDNHWLLFDDTGAPEFVAAVEEFTSRLSLR